MPGGPGGHRTKRSRCCALWLLLYSEIEPSGSHSRLGAPPSTSAIPHIRVPGKGGLHLCRLEHINIY